MQIKYQNIVLRDMRESDIDDDIRWNTVETQWALWDAPWEIEEELRDFDPEKYRQEELEWLKKHKPDHRLSLELDTADGVHIGSVSTYCLDENLDWKELITEDDRRKERWAVGIEINEPAYWSGGWGTQALTALIRYHLSEGYTDLYTQTWSGNFRMIGLAKKLGFRECWRLAGIRQVRGKAYDGLTFQLDRAAFEAHCASLAWVRPVEDPEEKGRIAASVLADLPDWFGMPEYTAEYVRVSQELPFWAAERGGEALGFAALKETGPRTAEIYVMGVRPGHHREGLGGQLFDALYRYARRQGYAFLQVKTVQEGRYEEYDRTNAFYREMGFTELECFPALWDAWNPCQVLIMAVGERKRVGEAALELYVPKVEDLWFRQTMQADPATMAYNVGWDVAFEGYHPDTGCIDCPEDQWRSEHDWLVGHGPERFYAYVREVKTGSFVGEVNFHYTPSDNWHDMGILVYAPYRGRGYGVLALELLLQQAFVDCGVEKLHNSFEKTRDAAFAIHRRCGFRQVGTSSAQRFGAPVELVELELTRREYLARQARKN